MKEQQAEKIAGTAVKIIEAMKLALIENGKT